MSDHNIIRVKFHDANIELYDFSTGATSFVDSVADLSEDVRCKVAALAIMKIPPAAVVEGVGERIENKLFWIYQDWGA
jgi:hypothetical protein